MVALISLDLVSCPECLLPAAVVDRFTLYATDGPVPHSRTVCVTGHRFMLPTESLPGGGPSGPG